MIVSNMHGAKRHGKPAKLFYSYAHEDRAVRDKLESHLSVLKDQGELEPWSDLQIQPGKDWDLEIRSELEHADIILLLISSDFLASEYIKKTELQRALEKEREGSVRVIPVILRPCYWEIAEFARLQALPTGTKPISTWDDEDQALADVARGIHLAIQDLRTGPVEREEEAPPPLRLPPATSLHLFPNEPLRILGEDYDPFRALQQVFEGAHKGVHPDLPELPVRSAVRFQGNTHRRILAELRNTPTRVGLPYDLVALPYRALGYCVDKGLVEELDPDLGRRHGADYIWWREMGMIDGALFGVPLSALTMILAIRADVFERFDLEPPDTWTGYVDLIESHGPGSLPLAPDLLEGRWHVSLWYNWLNYLYAHHANDLLLYCPQRYPVEQVAESLAEGTHTFLRVVSALARHNAHTNTLPHFSTANWDDGIEQFSRGNLLMHLVFNDALETLRQKMQVSVPEARVEFLPVPRAFDSELRHGQVEGWVLCVAKGTRYYWPAIALLDWFLDETVQREYSRWGGASAHRRVIASEARENDAGSAFEASIDDFVAGRSTIDLVKNKDPGAPEMVAQIVESLYDVVLEVAAHGESPQAASGMLMERIRWYLRVAGR